MSVTLDRNLFAFTVQPNVPATLELLAGELAWSHQQAGPFVAEGTLRQGQRREFARSAVVQAAGHAEFDLTYAHPAPLEPPAGPPEPPIEPPPPPPPVPYDRHSGVESPDEPGLIVSPDAPDLEKGEA